MSSFPGKYIYPLLDIDSCARFNVDPVELVTLWSRLGLGYFQLRAKGYTEPEYIRLARDLKQRFPRLEVFANDLPGAVLSNPGLFAGLHLGQEDLQRLDKVERSALRTLASGDRAMQGPMRGNTASDQKGILLGLSTHNLAQVQSVLNPVDGREGEKGVPWSYFAIGPLHPTESKPGGVDPVLSGEELKAIFEYYRLYLDSFRSSTGDRPQSRAVQMVFIGGLNAGRLQEIFPIDFNRHFRFRPVIALIGGAQSRESLEEIQAVVDQYIA